MALASDVLAWMYSHKPMVPWLESTMRDAMRAERSRDFGSVLSSDNVHVLRNDAVTRMREAHWSGADNILRQWVTPRHENHIESVTRILADSAPDVERYRCAQCGETLTLAYEMRMHGTMLILTITPHVS